MLQVFICGFRRENSERKGK